MRRLQATSARGWPGWLAALALALHLLVPGLCLAQQLASAPLGALCTAEPGRGVPWPSPESMAGAHLLEHCEHCVPGSALLAHTTARSTERPPPTAAPKLRGVALPPEAAPTWRPPPRGPPLSG